MLKEYKNSRETADKVSIVMPSWNASKFIKETINSVISQSHKNWELIIVDDCSIDDTFEILKSFQKKDKRIQCFRLKKNSGPAAARNLALNYALGRYVAFLDSDDLWVKFKLENGIKVLSNTDFGLLYTGFRRFSSERKKETFQKRIRVPTHTNYFQLLGNNVIATSTVIIDRTKVIPFKMQDTYYDDFDCWLHLLKNNVKAIGIDEVQMLYRILPGSVSRNKLKSAKFVWKALREREKLRLLSAIFHFWRYFFNGIKKYYL